MVRAPCCEKMGLKKGPWTPEEDQILVAYIQKQGHGNWRALPKQAGLLRCGKSCRLRWTNYLRPDIKRGNFSREEEETIYKLHELLGNRWSAIAAQLPGRTDNEIKNVWHTHLKKSLDRRPAIAEAGRHLKAASKCNAYMEGELKLVNFTTDQMYESHGNIPTSPQQSSSNLSTSATDSSVVTGENIRTAVKAEYIGATDENLWSEALSAENTAMSEYSQETKVDPRTKFQFPPASLETSLQNEDGMDFWINHFLNESEFIELPKI